jgi:hypothetical protein
VLVVYVPVPARVFFQERAPAFFQVLVAYRLELFPER